VNARAITVAKINVSVSDLTFKAQVIGVITQVLQTYYNLAADYEDIKAKQNAADVAQKFYANVKEQIRLGSGAPPEGINAENQVLTTQQAAVDSQSSLQQKELQLKNMISRNGTADPVLARARIVPVDAIVIPPSDNLPPLPQMIEQARANRADLLAFQASDAASAASALGTRNGLLPNLQVFGGETDAGLAGRPRPSPDFGQPDPFFYGGLGPSLRHVVRGHLSQHP